MNKKKVFSIIAIIALVAVLSVCLVACNADNYKSRLEKKGYNTMMYKGDEEVDLGLLQIKIEGDTEWVVSGSKNGLGALLGNGDTVFVIKFKKVEDAKSFKEKLGDDIEAKRLSKIVIFGTEQGVKDAQ